MQLKIINEDIAGTVILYNSPITVLDNIKTYINQVQRLYVVDNSINPNDELIVALQAYPQVHYHSFGENIGIATALNWAAKQSALDGFKILLTMDDDTKTPSTMVSQMIDFWNKYPKPIGILSGVHRIRPDTIFLKPGEIPYQTLLYTLASGNMLNLTAFTQIGGFLDKLFIDHVDVEYGLRLNINGYQVVELKNVELEHNLGYPQESKIGNWVIKKFRTHSPIRFYYFMRNGIYIVLNYFRLHPLYVWIMLREFLYRIYISILFTKNRGHRIKMLLWGIIDGLRGQMGEYSKYNNSNYD